jgi:hypothetical protein
MPSPSSGAPGSPSSSSSSSGSGESGDVESATDVFKDAQAQRKKGAGDTGESDAGAGQPSTAGTGNAQEGERRRQ